MRQYKRPATWARQWTPEEDAILLAAKKLSDAARQTGRTFDGCKARRRLLGKTSFRRWSKLDDWDLRDLWESTASLDAIANKLHRTPLATYFRAQLLGLPLGVPDGCEYLSHAAARCGYHPATLKRILAWAKVPMHVVRSPKTVRGELHRRYVNADLTTEAVKRWLCRGKRGQP